MSNHNTGTSGEFYVLSVLLRLGIEAYLTLGNTTVSGAAAYLAELPVPNHFYIFVSYNGQMTNPSALPSCYIVPSSRVSSVLRVTSGKKAKPGTVNPRVGVNAKMKLLKASNALNAWHLL